MNCSDDARRLAFEPLAIERGRNRLLREPERAKRRPVLAGDRQDQRIISGGPAVGETNFHLRQSLKGERSAAPFRMQVEAWQRSGEPAPGRLSPRA